MRKTSLPVQAFSIIAATQAAGLVCWNLVPRLAPLLLDRAGASPAAISLIIGTLPQLFVLILTPLVSVWSDNHRGQWGRRRPFIWWSAPFFCLSILGIHFAAGNVLFLGCALVIFSLCAIIPATLVFYIVPETIPRNRIGEFTAWNGALSSLCAALFNYCGLDWSVRHPLAAVLAAIAVYAAAAASLAVIPKEEETAEAPEHRPGCVFTLIRDTAVRCVRDSVCEPVYLLFFLSMGFNQASMILRTLFGILFATKDLGMGLDDFGRISGVCAGIGAVTAVFLGRYADRRSPVSFYLRGSLTVAAVSLAGFFWVHSPGSYRIVAILTTVCYSFQSVAYTPLLVSVFPEKKYGQLSGINTAVCTLTVMAGAAAGGWMTGYLGFRFMFLWDFIMTGIGTMLLLKVKQMRLNGAIPGNSGT